MFSAATKTDGVSIAANYIEDVFSTYVYAGNASTQTITNGIDLSTKGGLVWIKSRGATKNHAFFDTNRGATTYVSSNLTTANTTTADTLTSFNTTGFSLGANTLVNANTEKLASWSFRKQEKFFDVVTYTGNGANRTIAHNLKSVPGCIIVKCTSNVTDWKVYHRNLTSASYVLDLNLLAAEALNSTIWNDTAPTSTEFSLGVNSTVNGAGRTYVAYLFAHDAGGFGASGSENAISCGSFVISGGGSATVNLGYEPQWILVKDRANSGNWWIIDTIRGMSITFTGYLYAPSNVSEASSGGGITPTATGFTTQGLFGNGTFIYVAIRRGPMKTPTTSSSIFIPVAQNGGGTFTTNFPVDLTIAKARNGASNFTVVDRLRGSYMYLATNTTGIEQSYGTPVFTDDSNTSLKDQFYGGANTVVYWNFLRAPGFFDVVCYSGTGSSTTQAHNLKVTPELMIVKRRLTNTADWAVYSSTLGATKYLVLNTTAAEATSSAWWNNTAPTSSVFTIGTDVAVNLSAASYVAYLFATVGGVSKVGSYTGTGALQTVNCGFSSGARFVLIKRTDSTGDWWAYDSARGITSGNDPYLLFNSTAIEVTSTNYVDTASTGFQVTAAAPAGLNANGGTYIFLAIA